ncbi:very long chain fatty acid elongase 7-like [Brevipalpus obovatus]|uniref:very long chain fatty acid elongase 7-like n=1 Tax=Brevipalpus obovatus TaxID=246614 RepID=UPI003D9F614E
MESHHQTNNNSSHSSDLFQYYYEDVWEKYSAPRISWLPLMQGGPWPVLLITLMYLIFVKLIGPMMMSKRKPYDLRNVIFRYNVFMVVFNSICFFYTAYFTRMGIRTWQCGALEEVSDFDRFGGWIFFMSKFVDFFDTVFFVLRKKYTHVSFLHVVHHALVPINCWIGLKFVPSWSAAFMPFLNSFVHAVMYSYYALSTMGPEIRPYLWWKKYLTQLQIIQICFVCIHCLYLAILPSCKLPKIVFLIAAPQGFLILFLFCSFFVNAYLRKPSTGVDQNLNKQQQTLPTPSSDKIKAQ